ncbi:MAG: hypothetical protein WKF84_13765 [Pyrinomonadaceae bacterium]
MDFAQLSSTEPDYLKTTRAALEQHGMFLELSISGQVLDDREAFARAARVAHQLGVSRLRAALLSGRRYENFQELAKWKQFANESGSGSWDE